MNQNIIYIQRVNKSVLKPYTYFTLSKFFISQLLKTAKEYIFVYKNIKTRHTLRFYTKSICGLINNFVKTRSDFLDENTFIVFKPKNNNEIELDFIKSNESPILRQIIENALHKANYRYETSGIFTKSDYDKALCFAKEYEGKNVKLKFD